MKWMLRRRRKMMMWRGRMLRRKTDPKTRKHTLCEPAQSKRTWTFEKSHFAWKFTGQMPHAPATTSIKHRALTLTVRTPSVWPHCFGHDIFYIRYSTLHIQYCILCAIFYIKHSILYFIYCIILFIYIYIWNIISYSIFYIFKLLHIVYCILNIVYCILNIIYCKLNTIY